MLTVVKIRTATDAKPELLRMLKPDLSIPMVNCSPLLNSKRCFKAE
ncbi:hypothetical protein HMPREF9554_03092 [Treponema phagedenis F0421]|nr:hypothetical protein HMPREF9554_03092 [Treponema phagedenis F0421]